MKRDALIMQSVHSPLAPSYAQIYSTSPCSQTPSVSVVRVLYRGFLPGRAEEDNEKTRLKDYQCTSRDSNMKTTGCRYRINATNLCAVYISSFCRLVRLLAGLHCLSVLNHRFVCRVQAVGRCVKRSAGRQEGSACCWRREVALSCCEHGEQLVQRAVCYISNAMI
jgi:hypothetical protein